MLSSNRENAQDTNFSLSWDDLGHGAPTIIGLAKLCCESMANGLQQTGHEQLSAAAQTLLFAARERGVMVVTGSNKAFDSVDRFLSVHVELDEDTVLAFKDKRDPQLTIRFLDALRELCASGLVMHHLYREFSLSRTGFEVADKVDEESVREQLALGTELGRLEW